MRFVLYDQKSTFRFEVLDESDKVVFKSDVFADQAAATSVINQAIDSLREESRYLQQGNRLILVGDSNQELAEALIPAGTDSATFILERVADASDQEKFSVTLEKKKSSFGTGGPPVAPSRDEMTSHYDFSLQAQSGDEGISEITNGDKYYYVYVNAQGEPIIYSRDLPNTSRLHSAIRSLLRYSKENYVERWQDGDTYKFRVVSPQGFELGRSPGFRSDDQRQAAIDYYLKTAKNHKKAFAKPTRGQKLTQQEYQFDRVSETHQEGFEEYKAENKKQYFTFNDQNGAPLLYSQGYKGAKSRETGLRSVISNGWREDRYRIKEHGGKFILVLLAGNNQEIGRTREFNSEGEALRYQAYLIEKLTASASVYGVDLTQTAAKATEITEFEITREIPVEEVEAAKAYVPNASREADNYLVCSAYSDRINDSRHSDHEDVIVFQHDNGLYYFATLDASNAIALRSEGYPTKGARDNGMNSVLRNREMPERFKSEEMRGLWFTVLYAGNHQEIGRSCPKKSEEEAKLLWPGMGLAAAALVAETPTIEEAKEAYIPNASREADNYLVCSAYSDRINDSTHPDHSDVIVFQHENGLYYFATLDSSNEIALRSEGYPTKGARDNGLNSVLRNREMPERFKSEEIRGLWFTVLYAGNHQEIGRSCPKKSEDEAKSLWPGIGLAAAALTASIAPVTITKPAPVEELGVELTPDPVTAKVEDKEDDYLLCKEYAGRKVNDTKNSVSLFKHENGQYYFAIIGENKKVRLRSEGFRTALERDKELSGALRFINDESMYKRISKAGYHINVLYDETGREVGRSCAEKEIVPFIPPVAIAAPVAAMAAAAVAAKPSVAAPPPTAAPPVRKEAAAAIPPAAVEKGCLAWWWWLLGALLLAVLAYYFWQSCNPTKPTADVAAIVSPPAATVPEVEPTPIVEPEPEPVVEEAPVVETAPVSTPPPAPTPVLDDSGACGGIAVGAEYNDRGIPLMPYGNYGGLAGNVQDFLRSTDQGPRSFSLSNIGFMPPGNDYAIEPCSVGDVDRLAAVLRNNPNATITIRATTDRDCSTLRRLLVYRGIDSDKISTSPSSVNEIVINP